MRNIHWLTKAGVVALAGIIGGIWLPAKSAGGAEAARKPNIVVIVADDLGYAEVVPSGAQTVPTPRIHSIRDGGVGFTSGYVTCPVCSPTRAGLITGRYQQRFGHEFNPGPAAAASDEFGLPLSEVTLADRLKKLGYATGMVGKWHLGYKEAYRPQRRGFDEFFGFLGGAHSYVDSGADAANLIYRGNERVDEKEYLTDAFGREAVAYIERHKQQPFFLYLTFNAVHAPLQAPAKYVDRFADIKDERRRTFAAMLSAMDDNVGLVLDKLKQEKLDEETLIFFIADNGGPTPNTTSRNDPLHGFKGQVWEGGIRVPFMVQWKGRLPEGKLYDQPVAAIDIVPTAVAAAGGSVAGDHPVDGVDLIPYLRDEVKGRPHEKLYWRFGQQWAVRQGNFKLLQPLEGSVQLFNLAEDIGEKNDLAAQKPQMVKDLQTAWKTWDAQLMPPKWKPQQRGARARRRAALKKTTFDRSTVDPRYAAVQRTS